ncbi:MAG TPA: RNA polymerase sigma factor [Kofleriaceae bacterium]|nr:RNA polymerase sigma factor [Kofleriaceae bacterium]
MGTVVTGQEFKAVIAEHWRALYHFAFRMALDQGRACDVVEETFLRAYVGSDKLPAEPGRARTWLLHIASHVLESKLSRTPEVSFDLLDETLRSEATRTDFVRSLTEPRRDFLLWELKQGCMTAVINCLSPGERSAFVLANIMKLGDDEAARVLGITKSAYKVRLSRAQKKVTDYLAPRCEHVDPLNPCRCPARVGVAVSKGFIKSQGEVSLRKPSVPFGRYGSGPDNEDEPLRDVVAIYGNLPEPDPPEELEKRLHYFIDQGEWDRVRAQKQEQRA